MSTEEQNSTVESPSSLPVMPPPPPVPSVIPPPPPPQQLTDPTQTLPYSNAQPVWQFILLNLCTFTLYHIVWFYRNWHLLKRERGLRVTPLARTIFAPLFAWSFFSEVQQLAGSRYAWRISPSTLATLYFILLLFARILDRLGSWSPEMTTIPKLWLMATLCSFLPLIPAVCALNAFWAEEQPGQPIRHSLSPGAIGVVIIGGLLMLIVIIGISLPD